MCQLNTSIKVWRIFVYGSWKEAVEKMENELDLPTAERVVSENYRDRLVSEGVLRS